jgi:hypothetical protein
MRVSAHRQFGLKSLLIATALICVGLGCVVASARTAVRIDNSIDIAGASELLLMMTGFLASGPLIGAGLLIPFRNATLGACLGFLTEVVMFFGYHAVTLGWKAVWGADPLLVSLTMILAVLMALNVIRKFR